MIDLYYKFTDQQEMLTLLEPLGMVVDGTLSIGGHQYAAWEVGQIDGIDGWHLNVRNIDLDLSSLDVYQVAPVNPICVWA